MVYGTYDSRRDVFDILPLFSYDYQVQVFHHQPVQIDLTLNYLSLFDHEKEYEEHYTLEFDDHGVIKSAVKEGKEYDALVATNTFDYHLGNLIKQKHEYINNIGDNQQQISTSYYQPHEELGPYGPDAVVLIDYEESKAIYYKPNILVRIFDDGDTETMRLTLENLPPDIRSAFARS